MGVELSPEGKIKFLGKYPIAISRSFRLSHKLPVPCSEQLTWPLKMKSLFKMMRSERIRIDLQRELRNVWRLLVLS